MEAGGDEATDGTAPPDLTCPHCGASNPASTRVCQECGRRLDLRDRPGRGAAATDAAGLPDVEAGPRFRPLDGDDLTREGAAFMGDPLEAPRGDLRTCGQCGAVDAASARFCRVCGAALGAPAMATAPPARSAGLGRLAMAMLVLALIAAAAVAGRLSRWPPASPTAPPSARPSIAPAPLSNAAVALAASDAAPSGGPAPATPPPAAVAAASPPSVAATPPATSPIRRMVSDPVWVRRPRAAAVAALYPAAAEEHGLPGQATIDCAVRADGRIGGCRVVAESPPGLGFGRATLRLAPDFRMTTVSRSGQPVAGRRVRVPIRWRLTE